MQRAVWRAATALACAVALGAAANAEEEKTEGPFASAWTVPDEGCKPSGGLRAAEELPGASLVFLFEPGAVIDAKHADSIRRFVPKEVWDNRERFFYDGMRLEIGPCFRDYAPPAFFDAATEKFRGQAKLGEAGGLQDYGAGLPFAPDTIDPKDPQAGQRWAWNVEQRYQGAGLRGRFRVTDLLGRVGHGDPFEGEIFEMRLAHRADLAERKYRVPFFNGKSWVAGGVLHAPAAAKDYAWRQYRDEESLGDAARLDDLHAFLPEWRRVRRLPAPQVEGLYMPSFRVGVAPAQNLSIVEAGGEPDRAAPDGGTTLETKRSGFEGLVLRPLLWSYRVAGVADLLAPINVEASLWPDDEERSFGPWGVSFASDRWELRRTLAIEGAIQGEPRERGESRLMLYVDLQTLAPLYSVSWDAKDRVIDVGVFAGRWSEDRGDYPKWPDDPQRPVRVIDSVAAAFANLGTAGSWRRESWEIVSLPPPDEELQRMNGLTGLGQDH